MHVQILASGSDGNCVCLDHTILIDAGITSKAYNDWDIHPTACLITHRHADHMKPPLIRALLATGVICYLPESAILLLQEENITKPELYARIKEIQANIPIQIGNIRITPIPEKHYDLVNYAFVVEKDGDRLLYATDLDTLERSDMGDGLLHLGQFDTIMLEGNYDENYLRAYLDQMVSLVPEAEDLTTYSTDELDVWVRTHYRKLPKEVARNAFRAIQNRRHLSKGQARAYATEHLKPGGSYYELHRSKTFYEAPEDWNGLIE